MDGTIPRKDVAYEGTRGFVRTFAAGVLIYAMIAPLLALDACFSLYQAVYFPLQGIPQVRRRDYIVIDRGRLQKLTWLQRLNCVYCDYANGLIAWVKAVVNLTEIYSCAIKHGTPKRGQEHQTGFYEYQDFL